MTSTATPKLARHLLTAAALGAALFSFEARAFAQDAASPDRFGSKGQFAVTAEDLMGVYNDHVDWKDDNGFKYSEDNTRFSLLFSTRGGGRYTVTAPASTVGFHYFIIDGLSLGGNLGYESRSGSWEQPAGPGGATRKYDLGTGSTFIFEPKVGYALMLSDLLGFWFRGGISVAVDDEHPDYQSTIPEDKYTFWLFSADVLFTIMPVDHFGFYVGPGLDLSFTGTYTHTDTGPRGPVSYSTGTSYRRFKLGAGMIAYF
jgi:hypothetical protein